MKRVIRICLPIVFAIVLLTIAPFSISADYNEFGQTSLTFRPWYSFSIVIILALGVGASAALFSLTYATLVRTASIS